MSRTGMSRLDSHDAAFTRCERCSRLIVMSLRLRMPRTVGTRPTAVYGLIMRALLDGRSATRDARDFPDPIVVQLDRHLVLARAVRSAIDHRAPPRRRHPLVLRVGPAEPGDDVVVARAGRDERADRLARRRGPVPRRGADREPPARAYPPADPPAHVLLRMSTPAKFVTKITKADTMTGRQVDR